MFYEIFLLGSCIFGIIQTAVIPEKCDCRDWYGNCRTQGENWVDDDTWSYSCMKKTGEPSTFMGCQDVKVQQNGRKIPVGMNQTIKGFWYSCDENEFRVKYQKEPRCQANGTERHVGERFREGIFEWLCLETGRWVTGCYYQNETKDWVLLMIGETGYNGLVKHSCDRYKDNPGVVQYYAVVRSDLAHKSPTNKGTNQNLPDFIENRLKEEPIKWLHENVEHFIANDEDFSAKTRYLPASWNRP